MREDEKNKGKGGWGQRPPHKVGDGERVIKVKKRGSGLGHGKVRAGLACIWLG